MSPMLNRLMPSSRSFDLVFLGVVLILDQIDVVNMHTVVHDVRDVVRAIRTTQSNFQRARSLLCLLDAVIALYESVPEDEWDSSARNVIRTVRALQLRVQQLSARSYLSRLVHQQDIEEALDEIELDLQRR